MDGRTRNAIPGCQADDAGRVAVTARKRCYTALRARLRTDLVGAGGEQEDFLADVHRFFMDPWVLEAAFQNRCAPTGRHVLGAVSRVARGGWRRPRPAGCSGTLA
jgi:hypothetical protein